MAMSVAHAIAISVHPAAGSASKAMQQWAAICVKPSAEETMYVPAAIDRALFPAQPAETAS